MYSGYKLDSHTILRLPPNLASTVRHYIRGEEIDDEEDDEDNNSEYKEEDNNGFNIIALSNNEIKEISTLNDKSLIGR